MEVYVFAIVLSPRKHLIILCLYNVFTLTFNSSGRIDGAGTRTAVSAISAAALWQMSGDKSLE